MLPEALIRGLVHSALALAALLPAAASRAPRAAPAADDPPAPLERCEHFVLVAPHPRPGEGPRGRACWRRRRTADGWQLELELEYFRERVHVWIVECLTPDGPRHVYREVFPGGGRTVLAEWRDGGRELHTIESGVDGSVRESCDSRRGAVMPLYLAELLRGGRATQGSLFVFDPLARGLERQRLQTSYGSAEAGPAPGGPEQGFLRSVALVREDGDAAARFRFRGTELVGFQFQEGGLVARRADGEEYSASGAEEPARTPADEALPGVKDLSAAVPSGASLAAPQARRVE